MRFLLAIALFVTLSLKMASAVHATEYGDGPHDHDGVPCVMALHGSHYADDWIPPVEAPLVVPMAFEQAQQFQLEALIVPTVRVTPPGRAPPLS